MKKVIFTGGGSGGHVVPAITLIKKLRIEHKDVEIHYIGSKDGIERDLVDGLVDSYTAISAGKLRRYISFSNFVDIFKILIGLFQSAIYFWKHRGGETLVFATGGFVAVAPVIAARLCGIYVIIHEQTSRAGLANRICARFANKVFLTFDSSQKFFPTEKSIVTGLPLREEIFNVSLSSGKFEGEDLTLVEKPIVFITGGGNGSLCLNNWVKESINELEGKYFVIHQVGKSYIKEYSNFASSSYRPVEFIKDEMIDIFKLSTFIISRAGANTVCELMALGKKSIFVPLKIAQKNEQFHNAMSANEKCGSIVLEEDNLSVVTLFDVLKDLDEESYKQYNSTGNSPSKIILKKILEQIKL